ncbi:MAG: VanZ family protein [Porticoccaceae bacterium]|nr:VanZ family protein [Porticoccaceae bacterium]
MSLQASFKIFFWAAILAVMILSLLPITVPHELVSWQDKVHHSVAYGLLFLLAISAYGYRFALWRIGVVLALFGLLMEIAQSMTAYRYGDPLDFLANISGILLVGIAYRLRRRRS